jgi:hypothetical protein
MQLEYSHMPTIFDTTMLRAVLRRERRRGFAHAVRIRLYKWQFAMDRRKRERALEECLRRLDRRTLDDIGLGPASESRLDKLDVEIEVNAVRSRARRLT